MKPLSLVLSTLLMACSSTQIIRDSEYRYSEAAFKFSNPKKALEEFPQKEKDGFVTSIEKSWLGFWADEKDFQNLLYQSQTLDSRQYISLSREAEYFFFNESEEGYIPAEHEVIVMHLLTSMYFMRNGQWEEARVEVKKASYFVESFFKTHQKHFDDPALRIWLASVWTALGEWNEAQVDLRRAYDLSKDKSLLVWIEMKQAPREIYLAFEGSGPKVTWTFGNPLPEFSQKDDKPNLNISYSTLPWFERHQERNTLIREQISTSNYMSQYYGIQLGKNAERSVGFISATTLRATGVLLGTAVAVGGIYLIASVMGSSSGEALALPITAGMYIGTEFWKTGNKVDSRSMESSRQIEEAGQETLKTYRFVRFMPSWISVTDQIIPTATGKDIILKSPKSPTTVHFIQKF